MRILVSLCVIVGCGSSKPGTGDDAVGIDSAHAGCFLTSSSSLATADTSLGSCMPLATDATAFSVSWVAAITPNTDVTGHLSCNLPSAMLPQTLGVRLSGQPFGCTAETEYQQSTGVVSWATSDTTSVMVTVTSLAPPAGSAQLTLDSTTTSAMTVTGTF